MEYLDSQEEFERLIGRGNFIKETSGSTIIYFGATWCAPCRQIAPKVDELMKLYPHIRWLKCDVDRNHYTAGFCGISSIPAFMAIHNTKILGQSQISNPHTLDVWVNQMFSETNRETNRETPSRKTTA